MPYSSNYCRRNRSSHNYNPNFPTPPRLRASTPQNVPSQNAPVAILRRGSAVNPTEPKRTSEAESSSGARRNRNISATTTTVATTAASTNIDSGGTGKNSASPTSSGASSSKQQSNRKGWKGKSNESRFLFKESEDGNFNSPNDERTTVMIRNIPNKYR